MQFSCQRYFFLGARLSGHTFSVCVCHPLLCACMSTPRIDCHQNPLPYHAAEVTWTSSLLCSVILLSFLQAYPGLHLDLTVDTLCV